jgi:GIY-YIG catalytic domain
MTRGNVGAEGEVVRWRVKSPRDSTPTSVITTSATSMVSSFLSQGPAMSAPAERAAQLSARAHKAWATRRAKKATVEPKRSVTDGPGARRVARAHRAVATRRANRASPRPHSVYAALGHDGELLYIGSAVNPERRIRDHKRYQPWAHEVADWKVLRWLDSEPKALDYEHDLIASEHPKYNVVGNPRVGRQRPVFSQSAWRWLRG